MIPEPGASRNGEPVSERRRVDPESLALRFYPDPVLFRRAEPLPLEELIRGEFEARIRGMFRVMAEHRGIGLAGPQVGWSARVFVVNLAGASPGPGDELVFINPRILSADGADTVEEGCLSLPDIRADVIRPERVRVSATNLAGKPFELTAFDMLGRCIQHEYDHLDGILFVTRLTLTARLGLRRALKELEREFKKRAG